MNNDKDSGRNETTLEHEETRKDDKRGEDRAELCLAWRRRREIKEARISETRLT